jgi:hypothetical protein
MGSLGTRQLWWSLEGWAKLLHRWLPFILKIGDTQGVSCSIMSPPSDNVDDVAELETSSDV